MRVALKTTMTSMCLAVASAANAQVELKGDRYLCYVVERIGGGEQVHDKKLRDQFGIGAAAIMKPRYVCNPIELEGKKPIDPRMHTICYEVRSAMKPRPVAVNTEFGAIARIELGQPQLICVPGTKKELPK